jgi:hypothetical protein
MIHISNRGLAFYVICMALILAGAALLHIGSWLTAGLMLVSIAIAIAISYRGTR